LHWQWEIKSVNGKSLDVRCRLPAGFDALEAPLRAATAQLLRRGNIQVSLTVSGGTQRETVVLNEEVLDQVLAAGEQLRDRIGGEPLRADMLLSLRGVLEPVVLEEDEAEIEARNAAMLASFASAAARLAEARAEEGERLATLLSNHLDRIEALADRARDAPARSVEAIRTRLAEQVARLMEAGGNFDRDRLHQEAVLIATRSDIQEELDRLYSHAEAARTLLAEGGAIGRKFDFLSQEFNREANTLCAKAIDRSLTAIGLDLKTVIDQMREQVQNIE
jgi:uncharacterized protein (TIGR00255 family)